MAKKSIEELAPVWTSIINSRGYIPNQYEIEDDVPAVNGKRPSIANPSCCLIGEIRGGDCYFYQSLFAETGNGTSEHPDGVDYLPNPKYCEECNRISIEFGNLESNEEDQYFDEDRFNELVEQYELHYEQCHNGDKC